MKDNKLIAEFMGMTTHHQDNGCMIFMTPQGHNDIVYVTDLEYHKSWDWLMPVVDMCYQNGAEVNEIGDITHALLDCNREATYDAVVEFIKWYNKKQQQ